jgi:hypothetical protein
MVRNTYLELLHKSYLQLLGLKLINIFFKVLKQYGLCHCASSVKTEYWGVF